MHKLDRKKFMAIICSRILSVRQIAEKAGLRPATIYENLRYPDRRPHHITLWKLSQALDVDIEDICCDVPEPVEQEEPEEKIPGWPRFPTNRERYEQIRAMISKG